MDILGINFDEQEVNGEFILTANITDVETFKKVNQFVKAHGGSYRKPMSFVFATKPVFDEQPKVEKFEDHIAIIKVSDPVAKVEEPKASEPVPEKVEAEKEQPEPVKEETPAPATDKIIEMPKPQPLTGEQKAAEASKKLLEIMQKKQRMLKEMNNADTSKAVEPKKEVATEVKADAKPEPISSTPKKQPLEDVTEKLKAITAKVEAEKAEAKAKASVEKKPAEKKAVEIEVYPPASVEECEEFFNKLKKDKAWIDEEEHQEFMDMILEVCQSDEELRAFVTHKDYYKTWESAGRTYVKSVKEHKHGCTKKQLLPYMIDEYKKPIEKSVKSNATKKK